MQAMELGAVEVLAKPGGPYSVGELRHALADKLRAAASARLRRTEPWALAARASGSLSRTDPATCGPLTSALDAAVENARSGPAPGSVIAIGASTGGTEAIAALLQKLPKQVPPILIAQHIPPVFSKAFADRLNDSCSVEVREAVDNDVVKQGVVLIAPGDFHMLLRRQAGGYRVIVKTGPRVCYQRPSVDVLFASVAEAAGPATVGVLLTGMGADGAQGLLKLRQSGAHTIAQDEATSVVYGMPREAVALGAAVQVLPLPAIAAAMLAPRGASRTS